MPEILGFDLGGAPDVPCEIFEGDGVLGDIFDAMFPNAKPPHSGDADFALSALVDALDKASLGTRSRKTTTSKLL